MMNVLGRVVGYLAHGNNSIEIRQDGAKIEHSHNRLATQQLSLRVTSTKVLDRVGEAGFDPVYEERLLKRVVQQLIEKSTGSEILQGRFAVGGTIQVTWARDKAVFHK